MTYTHAAFPTRKGPLAKYAASSSCLYGTSWPCHYNSEFTPVSPPRHTLRASGGFKPFAQCVSVVGNELGMDRDN